MYKLHVLIKDGNLIVYFVYNRQPFSTQLLKSRDYEPIKTDHGILATHTNYTIKSMKFIDIDDNEVPFKYKYIIEGEVKLFKKMIPDVIIDEVVYHIDYKKRRCCFC